VWHGDTHGFQFLDLPKDLHCIYIKIGKIEYEIPIKLNSYPFACKGGHQINQLGLSIFAKNMKI
jgi:hypothetical protein